MQARNFPVTVLAAELTACVLALCLPVRRPPPTVV